MRILTGERSWATIHDSDNSPKDVVKMNRKGTRENEEAIVAYLADHEDARSRDIAEAVGISRARVNQLLHT